MADEKLLGTKDMKSWVSSAYQHLIMARLRGVIFGYHLDVDKEIRLSNDIQIVNVLDFYFQGKIFGNSLLFQLLHKDHFQASILHAFASR